MSLPGELIFIFLMVFEILWIANYTAPLSSFGLTKIQTHMWFERADNYLYGSSQLTNLESQTKRLLSPSYLHVSAPTGWRLWIDDMSCKYKL